MRLKKGANGESASRVLRTVPPAVLVRRCYVAGDNIGTWYLIRDRLCMYEGVGEKCKEKVKHRGTNYPWWQST